MFTGRYGPPERKKRGLKIGPFTIDSKFSAIVMCIIITIVLITLGTMVVQFVNSGGLMGNPEHVNVTRSEAARIARDYMGGGLAGFAQLSRRGGEYVWIVEVSTLGMRTRYYDVYVCAMTGDVLNTQQIFRDRE